MGDAATLHRAVLDQLASSGLDERAQHHVRDALLAVSSTADEDERNADVRYWLSNIVIEGFRGVGERTALQLDARPGFTLVVGRNGSGKSSFAEGFEAALTGHADRLDGSSAAWRAGWRNVHYAKGLVQVQVGMREEGTGSVITVSRTWDGNSYRSSQGFCKRDGHVTTLPSNWSEDLRRYRPFLTYADLGRVSGDPSKTFDALMGILGLDLLTATLSTLEERRRAADAAARQAADEVPNVAALVTEVDDDRARTAAMALAEAPPNTEALEGLLAGDAAPPVADSGLRGRLTTLSTLYPPRPEAVSRVVGELGIASELAEKVAGTDSGRADNLAALLEAALAHHEHHEDGVCPLCGQGLLDQAWKERTVTEIGRLRLQAKQAREARERLERAMHAARQLLSEPPAALLPSAVAGIDMEPVDTAECAQSWETWHALSKKDDPKYLAAQLPVAHVALQRTADAVRSAADEILRRMEDRWRPAANAVAAWLVTARDSAVAARLTSELSTATKWMKTIEDTIRDDRLSPLREDSAKIWQELRQESNVEIGSMHLQGSSAKGTRRKLDVAVSVDGTKGNLGVLSQGETHALGLALFLPRATSADSPFRFVVVDDPVQAMDPAKVEGLARVLNRLSKTRQVLVFTHDDRLAHAVRRLELDATILEVIRHANSSVDIVHCTDQVARYLDDARRLLRDTSMPDDLVTAVAIGCLRDAVDTVAMNTARRLLLAEGHGLVAVEQCLDGAPDTTRRVALALFGDANKGAKVMGYLNANSAEGYAADTLRAIKEGVHQPIRTDVLPLIDAAADLCGLLAAIRTFAR